MILFIFSFFGRYLVRKMGEKEGGHLEHFVFEPVTSCAQNTTLISTSKYNKNVFGDFYLK